MGGWGSGRPAQRQIVERTRCIDISALRRKGCLEEPWVGRWTWSEDGESVASVGLRGGRNAIHLNYRYRSFDEDWEDVGYSVPVVWSSCRFGGERPFFQCPGVKNGEACGRRVLKLYSGGKYFLCRICHDLGYVSQTMDELDRAFHRANKLRRRIREKDPNGPSGKPKGMHKRTYRRFLEAAISAELKVDDLCDAKLRSLSAQEGACPFGGRS